MYFLSLFFYWAFLSLESRHSYMFKFMTVTGLGGSFIALQRDSYPEAPVLVLTSVKGDRSCDLRMGHTTLYGLVFSLQFVFTSQWLFCSYCLDTGQCP